MKAKYLLTALLLTAALTGQAQNSQRQAAFNLSGQHLAIQGYDPVAYFTEGKSKKGRADLAVDYGGVIYRFANAANKASFLASPAKYETQYGGWCAYAMGSTGEKVSIDPDTFKIVNGKLYLFYNSFFNNTLKSWNKNENELNRQADQNWMKLYHP